MNDASLIFYDTLRVSLGALKNIAPCGALNSLKELMEMLFPSR
jgi:hypothetical protein